MKEIILLTCLLSTNVFAQAVDVRSQADIMYQQNKERMVTDYMKNNSNQYTSPNQTIETVAAPRIISSRNGMPDGPKEIEELKQIPIPKGQYNSNVPGGNVFVFCSGSRPGRYNPLRPIYNSICPNKNSVVQVPQLIDPATGQVVTVNLKSPNDPSLKDILIKPVAETTIVKDGLVIGIDSSGNTQSINSSTNTQTPVGTNISKLNIMNNDVNNPNSEAYRLNKLENMTRQTQPNPNSEAYRLNKLENMTRQTQPGLNSFIK